jgi:hypothetical protein
VFSTVDRKQQKIVKHWNRKELINCIKEGIQCHTFASPMVLNQEFSGKICHSYQSEKPPQEFFPPASLNTKISVYLHTYWEQEWLPPLPCCLFLGSEWQTSLIISPSSLAFTLLSHKSPKWTHQRRSLAVSWTFLDTERWHCISFCSPTWRLGPHWSPSFLQMADG